MRPLLTAAQMQQMDAYTIGRIGVPGAVLMETAGRGVVRHLCELYDGILAGGEVAVVCGKGNNGGDGFVAARCLLNRGIRVCVYLLGRVEDVREGGEARLHLEAFLGAGGRLVEVVADNGREAAAGVRGAVLVVDAVLGTGLSSDVRGLAEAAIGWINAAPGPVVSVDLPSGVSSDDGRICGAAVRADLTVTFVHPKRGHYLHPGAALTGCLRVVEIGVPPAIPDLPPPELYLVEPADLAGRLHRPPDAHKGLLGHVLVIGGSSGKAGAPALAALAALRTGAGLVTVAWPRGVIGADRLPLELMTLPLEGAGPHGDEWSRCCWPQLEERLAAADALVLGPGMGTAADAGEVLAAVLGTSGPPAVLDADALNLLARTPHLAEGAKRPLLLTPHPGEAARLLESDTVTVQRDRVGALATLVGRYGATVILKGAGTLVGRPGGTACLISAGNPGMATAGSGDVLSGVAGALLARGMDPFEAAWSAAYWHAAAGDRAADRLGREGMIASDLLAELPRAMADPHPT